MIKKLVIVLITMVLLLDLPSGHASDPSSSPLIDLTTGVHFLSPSGDEVLVPEGWYTVDSTELGLQLIPQGKNRRDAFFIEAQATVHHDDLPFTDAWVLSGSGTEGRNVIHLLWLGPEGKAWEAIGTVSGIRPRSSTLLAPRLGELKGEFLPPDVVKLAQPLHFLTPDGSPVTVPHGTYQVAGQEQSIRLHPKDASSSESLILEAKALTHAQTIVGPTADLLVSLVTDDQSLVLLFPDGRGLISQGSTSGVKARGTIGQIGQPIPPLALGLGGRVNLGGLQLNLKPGRPTPQPPALPLEGGEGIGVKPQAQGGQQPSPPLQSPRSPSGPAKLNIPIKGLGRQDPQTVPSSDLAPAQLRLPETYLDINDVPNSPHLTGEGIGPLGECTCNGQVATIVGTRGPDHLRGTPGNDVVCLLEGDDYFNALGGDDIVCGGEGWDSIEGGPGNDILIGGPGVDLLIGGLDRDYLWGGPNPNALNRDGGIPVSERLIGGDGLDKLWGGPGNDVLDGGAGSDHLFGGSGIDQLEGGPGRDYLYGGKDSDGLDGDRDDLRIDGGQGMTNGEREDDRCRPFPTPRGMAIVNCEGGPY